MCIRDRGIITNDERYGEVIKVWESTTNKVSNAMEENFDELKPILFL